MKEIWTTAEATYYPLVLTTFWALHKVVGLDPLPYHAANVLFHLGSALLLWRALKELGIPGAWIAAALWAIHPVMVQSVAWITEMKNTQSCFFYLLCVLFFLKWNITRTWWRFAGALFFGAMAMASKSSTVILPAVLALCLWWQNRRWKWSDLAALLPFALISTAVSGWTIWEQKFHSGAFGNEWAQTTTERAIIAGRDVCFYLGKLAWPHPLVFIYPHWQIDAADWLNYLPLAATTMAMVLAHAKGANKRPSCPSKARTGRNATPVTKSARKAGPLTSCSAERMALWAPVPVCCSSVARAMLYVNNAAASDVTAVPQSLSACSTFR